MGNTSKKMGSTNDNDDNHPPLSIESDKDASPKLDIIQADGVTFDGNSNDVHSGLPDGTELIPVVVNGLTALTTDVHMGIAAIRGFQWIEWKCMCIQQGDRWRALVAHQEQKIIRLKYVKKMPDVGPALLALFVG